MRAAACQLITGLPLGFDYPTTSNATLWARVASLTFGERNRIVAVPLLAVYGRELGKYFTRPSCTTVATGRRERSKK